jgi:hypothetical protein
MGKTSAEHMLLKVENALQRLEALRTESSAVRTELRGLRYCLGLLKSEQASTFAVPEHLALTPEGWLAQRPLVKSCSTAPRWGCSWNAKERADLRQGLLADGATVLQLAAKHRRTEQAINAEIARWFDAFKGE